jgi:hypothetical protein
MPKKGYKSITIRETLFEKLTQIAEKLQRSIPETVELIVKHYEKELPSE